MIEEAINADQVPEDLVNVLQQLPKNSVEHLADRFFRAQKRVECDRIIDLAGELGQPAIDDLRDMLRSGQPRQAASAVGLLSRLAVTTLLELLPLAHAASSTVFIRTSSFARSPTAPPPIADAPCSNCWNCSTPSFCPRPSTRSA